ncbi:hypothetical protein BATDEDRAFT_89880 [Batrachochytrium dendrobatidis JAM81]|uniref:Uncharacterized protein n=1 Tax=Batrachochytrium dendrobatidis (strain JAM81 / FGSC 10211) TaxID=684364 RepID=F4P5L4_BATDJ|nr:uncharacterized protein BATDEDRAFT_89880 [Batrachochytrium dendrobatidis JAM81]EGF79208.1 hypothetical protein BATDEDRAFT_89880 [Batrachochytrium dendrobatidis JAM81]|eukprot:XP_006680055.1 hypothetical protein BATDEDRAFT_89880 [Batrachochytrium dendrobatidis JAM81]
MTLHFVQLTLGNKTYKDKVSTEGCTHVAEFKGAIKNKFSPDLDSYAPHHLTLFQPDGTTEIDPETLVTDLEEIPWKPMVVTVLELPIPAPIGSSKKQLTYKGMSTEASCRKYLDALAIEIYFDYHFPTTYKKPTMGDVLAAKDAKQGRPSQLRDDTGRPILWWDYKTKDGIQLTTTPLPSRLSVRQWDRLKSLNCDTNDRIHDAQLPKTSSQKPFVVLPHTKFTTKEYVDDLQSIAAIFRIVTDKDELIVKDESDLSASSSSESGSPDKEKKM